MEPVTLTTDRLAAAHRRPATTPTPCTPPCQDPDIQRWTTIPSPYLRRARRGASPSRLVPDGWADGSMFTFGVFLPTGGS